IIISRDVCKNGKRHVKLKIAVKGYCNESIGSTGFEQTLPVKNHTPIKKHKRCGKEPSWVFKEGHFVKPKDPKK
ncbi:20941_t:CDS:2, partial [Dentiscutata erythropus]